MTAEEAFEKWLAKNRPPKCTRHEVALAERAFAAGFSQRIVAVCADCDGQGWVCESHPEVPWNEGEGCCGGAGTPCKCQKVEMTDKDKAMKFLERIGSLLDGGGLTDRQILAMAKVIREQMAALELAPVYVTPDGYG